MVCDIVNGGTPKTGVAGYWGGPHRWITPAEMGKRNSPYIEETERTITDLGLQNSSARMLPPESVILSSRAPIGHLVINALPMATNQGCKGLIPGSGVDHKFLFYYLSGIVGLLNDLGAGATFKELSGSKLKQVSIPIPPLPEQRRIVAILDEAFEAIATAKANTERNLQNAREVFSGLVAALLGSTSGPVSMKTLEDVTAADCSLSYGIVQPGDEQLGGLPIVRPVDLIGNVVSMDALKRIDPALAKSYARTTLKGNDVLLCVRGTTGTVAMADQALAGANVTRGIVPIRFDKEQVDQKFGFYLLRSDTVQRQIQAKTYGTALRQINIRDLRLLQLPVPPLHRQMRVGAELERAELATEQLTSTSARKFAALDELKQSLLHQAFTGALTDKAADKQLETVV
jgi:type I restriction enzyme S subunit